MKRRQRTYRQADALYELAGVIAKELGTNRTMVIELGVRELARMLDSDVRDGVDQFRKYLAGEARRLDEKHGPVGLGKGV